MRSLTELPKDQLTTARTAADAVMRLKAYLPPGGLLLMLLGRWRDEVGDALGIKRGDMPTRGKERRSLDELTSVELDTLSGAVGILAEVRLTATMDDPELPKQLREFGKALDDQKTEREQLRASIAS
jgi:hypothetical protein